MKKKMEADIAKTVDLSFHKIIKKAVAPTLPASPNKKFLTALSVLCVFMVLTFLVYMFDAFRSSVRSKFKLQEFFGKKIALVLCRDNTPTKFVNANSFARFIDLELKTPQIIAIASGDKKEGKSYFIENLLIALKSKNKKVKVITDSALRVDNCTIKDINSLNAWGKSGFVREELLEDFDLVIIETQGVKFSSEEANLLTKVDKSVFIVRNGDSQWSHVAFLRELVKELELENFLLVFNDYSAFSNYQGHVSIDNEYKGPKNGIFNLIRYYWRMYKALWTS